jgi:hypothetical protein
MTVDKTINSTWLRGTRLTINSIWQKGRRLAIIFGGNRDKAGNTFLTTVTKLQKMDKYLAYGDKTGNP